jgi:hypothetical protein
VQVLFSRHLGQLKQGQWFQPGEFSWLEAPEQLQQLLVYSAQHRFMGDLKGHCMGLLERQRAQQQAAACNCGPPVTV